MFSPTTEPHMVVLDGSNSTHPFVSKGSGEGEDAWDCATDPPDKTSVAVLLTGIILARWIFRHKDQPCYCSCCDSG